MALTIALAGNPNSGKTTLFNQLTGNHQYVGNWPGVTVEKKEGTLKGDKDVRFVDLPGIYSLSPYTNEEVVARQYLAQGKPDVIVDVVDASNLERSLYLATQLMEFGTPVVIALNQMDIVEKRGYHVDAAGLTERMGVQCVAISALKGEGMNELLDAARNVASFSASQPVRFSDGVEAALGEIAKALPDNVPEHLKRYYAIKTFERDQKAVATLGAAPKVAEIIERAEAEYGDDAEGIIANERYEFITDFIGEVYERKQKGESITAKIDKIVTNRIAALPIFVVVIALVYWIAVSTVGGVATDWMNDGVFGDGWYLDPVAIVSDGAQAAYDEDMGVYDLAQAEIEAYEEAGNQTCEYVPVDEETGEPLVDEAVTVDAAVYAEAQTVEEPDVHDYGLWIPGIPVIIEGALNAIHCADWLMALILDGIVGGVGSVLGFVPQILILFFLLAILEGCGYMARVAFILDRIFRRFGLSGKTFIPMLIGTGCGVPAIMASRTIESDSARRLTVMTTTFMPCSAKLPIIALFAGAIFAGAGWVAPVCYFAGIAAIIISGLMLKKTKPFLGEDTPFVMELPEYRLPRFVDLLRSMWERGWSFIKKAGTIILLSCILVWFLSNYGFEGGSFGAVEDMNNSLLASVGSIFAVIFAPLGWGDWQAAAAAVTGLIAKENLVGTMGVLYSSGAGLWANLAATYTVPAALSMMFFNLLCAPCFAAMGAIRREQGKASWFWASIGYECGFAYAVALCIYQIGSAISGNIHPVGLVVSILLIAFVIFMIARPAKRKQMVKLETAAEAA